MNTSIVRNQAVVAMAFLLFAAPVPMQFCYAQQPEFRSVDLENGTTLEYGVIVPENFDAAKKYPVLLALPPGAQNTSMVSAGFNLYWNSGRENGWIVISPVAPTGKFFNSGAEDLIPGFLDKVQETYQPEGGKFHLAGVSNGGTSAFRIAGKFPDRFHSLMALPGYPSASQDKTRLKKIKDFSIAMYAGEKDTRWVKPMKETAEKLKKLGANVEFEIIVGQGHVIQNWQDGKKQFGVLTKWHSAIMKKSVDNNQEADGSSTTSGGPN